MHSVDSPYAFRRLAVALVLMTLGNGGMFAVVTVLPAVQAEFGVSRAAASLPYTVLMIGFGLGGIVMGRLADRRGVFVPLLVGAAGLGTGFVAASQAGGIAGFAVAHALLIGFAGSSATFAPLIADTSLWFARRRGIAVGVCASGNYLAGALWPPLVQLGVEAYGWRWTYAVAGIVCAAAIAALAALMRERPPAAAAPAAQAAAGAGAARPFGLTPGAATALLCVAGLACCVAMSMPQVHIVALCTDAGYGTARGAQMLALMLAFGIASRLISGHICDRIGGVRTLLLGSALQGVALLMYLGADGLVSLYVVSALFGLFQGGIVPAYAIIIREHFPPATAGARVGAVLMFTLLGMALGGWMSGKAYDLTGTYAAAFANGLAWNLVNLSIAVWLLVRTRGGAGPARGQPARGAASAR